MPRGATRELASERPARQRRQVHALVRSRPRWLLHAWSSDAGRVGPLGTHSAVVTGLEVVGVSPGARCRSSGRSVSPGLPNQTCSLPRIRLFTDVPVVQVVIMLPTLSSDGSRDTEPRPLPASRQVGCRRRRRWSWSPAGRPRPVSGRPSGVGSRNLDRVVGAAGAVADHRHAQQHVAERRAR